MAFYHVNSCDCPVGCCVCGPPENTAEMKKKTAIYSYIESLIPRDLYMLKSTGELYEKARYHLADSCGDNEEFIGEIDSMTKEEGIAALFSFYGFMLANKYITLEPLNDRGSSYMRELIRKLSDSGVADYKILIEHAAVLYNKTINVL